MAWKSCDGAHPSVRGGDLCDVADDLELGDGDLLPCTRARRGEGRKGKQVGKDEGQRQSLHSCLFAHANAEERSHSTQARGAVGQHLKRA
jgi:hypothetical protein